MSGISKPLNVTLEKVVSYTGYVAKFADNAGNVWQLEALGQPEAIEPLVSNPLIAVSAKPITEEELKRLLVSQEGKLALTTQLKEAAPEPKAEPTAPSTFPPSLTLTFTLLERAYASPLLISFVIDPNLTTTNPDFAGAFIIKDGDINANVTCRETSGNVKMSLKKFTLPLPAYQPVPAGATGLTLSTRATRGESWLVEVSLESGSSAAFTLSGDLSVS